MGDATVGWIAAIIIGGIAGWLAEQFMKSDMGLIMNIVLGIVGAAVASAIQCQRTRALARSSRWKLTSTVSIARATTIP